MAFHASSYIKTTTVAVQRVRDQLVFPFTGRPQAMTVYVRFVVEYSGIISAGTALISVGSNAATSPYLALFISGSGTTSTLIAEWNTATGAVNSQSSTVTFTTGVIWEARVTLTAAGVLQLHYSIASAAEVSATAASAQVLPTAWASAHLMLNSQGTQSVNFAGYTHLWVGRGIQSRETCRRFAGVSL